MSKIIVNVVGKMTANKIYDLRWDYKEKKFREKYPFGMFQLQRMEYSSAIRWAELSINSYRTNSFEVYLSVYDKIYFRDSINNSFGKVTSYKTLKKLIDYSKRFRFQEELVNKFVQMYNNKEEIFKKRDDYYESYKKYKSGIISKEDYLITLEKVKEFIRSKFGLEWDR